VDDSELVLGVRPVRVRVGGGRLTVSGPACVSHTAVSIEGPLPVDRLLFFNELLKGSDLSDLLVDQDLLVTITVNGQSYVTIDCFD